jgi:hypothetical protein
MQINKTSSEKIEVLGNYAGLLSLIEVGLGSLLHSLHIPMAGLFLSLNQGYLLCRVSILTQDKSFPYALSNIAAVLKSLSPAGNKLGPMLSLSMQGLLFRLGLSFGINLFGLSMGMVLLSVWSFVQPLVTYYLFFGEKLFNAAEFLYQKTLPFHGLKSENLAWIFAVVVILKALLGIFLAVVAWKTRGRESSQEKLVKFARPRAHKEGSPVILALKDLTTPLFLVSLLGTGIFLAFSQHTFSQMIWYFLRPVAIGFIFFYFSRTLTLDRYLLKLNGTRYESFGRSCEVALAKVRKVL